MSYIFDYEKLFFLFVHFEFVYLVFSLLTGI